MAGSDWKSQKTTKNSVNNWKLLETTGTAGKGWTWLEKAGHRWKKLEMARNGLNG